MTRPATSAAPNELDYTIERRGALILTSGALPISVFARLTKEAPKGAVMDIHAGRLLGVGMVLGLPGDINSVIAPIEQGLQPPANPTPESAPISAAARRWLDLGRRGMSSNALFVAVHGYSPADSDQDPAAHPRDPADLIRCLRMLRETEAEDRIHLAVGLSPIWSALIERWDDLVTLLTDEIPDWPKGSTGSAPKTYALMQQLIGRAA